MTACTPVDVQACGTGKSVRSTVPHRCIQMKVAKIEFFCHLFLGQNNRPRQKRQSFSSVTPKNLQRSCVSFFRGAGTAPWQHNTGAQNHPRLCNSARCHNVNDFFNVIKLRLMFGAVSFARSAPQHAPASELWSQIFWPHGLVFTLIYQLSDPA